MKIKPLYILATAWLITQAVLWLANGTGTTNEALKYIGQAYHLQQGHHLDAAKYIFYIIPIGVIYACLALHINLAAVVVFQLGVNALATAAFYKTAKALLRNAPRSTWATLVFITFIPLQFWNSFLYTESLFYSLCVLYLYCFTVLPVEKKTTHLLRISITLALLFTRPAGILFLPITALYYLWQSKLALVTKLLVALASVLVAALLVNYLYTGGADMDILMPQQKGFVICYDYSISQAGIQTTNTGSPVNDMLYFIVHNPVYFFKLAMYRLVVFFTLPRPYYSSLHNAYLIVCMVLLYVPAIISLVGTPLKKAACFTWIFLPMLALFSLGVMLQCDDYNSRFVMPLFPFIILLATDGWAIITARLRATKSPHQ